MRRPIRFAACVFDRRPRLCGRAARRCAAHLRHSRRPAGDRRGAADRDRERSSCATASSRRSGADVHAAGRCDGHRRHRHDGLSRPHRHGQRRRARCGAARAARDLPHAGGSRALQAQRHPPPRARGGEGAPPRRAGARDASRRRASRRCSPTPTAASSRARARSSTSRRRSTSRRSARVADPRRGLQVVRTPVALHVSLALTGGGRGGGGGYPVSLLGSIAFVRQGFLDAQHQLLEEQRYDKTKTGVARPATIRRSTRSSRRSRARCRWRSRPSCRARSCAP